MLRVCSDLDQFAPSHPEELRRRQTRHVPGRARADPDHAVGGDSTVDQDALGRIFAGWTVDVAGTVDVPTLIVAGRRDSVVGYADAMRLLEEYPHATLIVVEDAGHALIHERPEVLGPLLADWLRRAAPA